MSYTIHYSCLSHIGNVRKMNQDNFICDGRYIDGDSTPMEFPLCGVKTMKEKPVFGIFDGMGGEECGEVASYIAAKDASTLNIGKDVLTDLSEFCQESNAHICSYAEDNGVSAMGTTAAMLAFTTKGVMLCNVGDTKIFLFSDGVLTQISEDHVEETAKGVKPPLTQNLGIPPTELIIEPYLAQGPYNHKDIYLICSDGLTDMVTTEEIANIIEPGSLQSSIQTLLKRALENGGKDNITMILLEIQREKNKLFNFKRKDGK